MLSIAKVIFKEKEFVEGYESLKNKKVISVQEHYNLIVDEVSDGRINQQVLWASSDDTALIEKLENLCMYEQVNLVVNINFFEGRPSKVVVLDILDETSEKQTVSDIFKRYEQKKKDRQE